MSHNPSPGPSQNLNNSQHSKQKTKSYNMSIISGAEDVKYHTKYKELKRTVKDIEAENDRIHYKVLQAKRNIQRMKLERAILYERLSSIPPSPDVHDRQAAPAAQPVPDIPPLPPTTLEHSNHHRESRNPAGPNDSAFVNYIPPKNSTPHARKEARPILDTPVTPLGLGSVPNNNSYPSRRAPSSGHHETRQLPPINSHLPPLPPLETSRSHASLHSPSLHHSHSTSPREHRRSHSGSRSHSHHAPPPLSYHPSQRYADPLPPVHTFHHSPTSEDAEMIPGPGKRMDFGELLERQRTQPAHTPHGPLSPRPRSSDSRSTAIHNHQRMGPGTYINDPREIEREREYERQREIEYEDRLREREREKHREKAMSREHRAPSLRRRDSGGPPPPHHSPPLHHHQTRYRQEYAEPQRHSSRVRDDPGYFHDSMSGGGAGSYPRLSRSGTPGSGSPASGSGMIGEPMSRPDSRDAPFYREDHDRRFRLRPVSTVGGEDLDFVHEDGRSQGRDRGGGGGGAGGSASTSVFAPHPLDSSSSRKRHRSDMDMDVDSNDMGGEGPAGGIMHPPPLPEDRGSKRHHRGHSRRGSDVQDDRMGS